MFVKLETIRHICLFQQCNVFLKSAFCVRKVAKKNSFSLVVPALGFISVYHMFDKVANTCLIK